MEPIRPIDYQITDILFPYRFAYGHLLAFSDHVLAAYQTSQWNDHIVQILIHGVFMIAELVPVINIIVALFDKVVCAEAFGRPSGLPPLPLPQHHQDQHLDQSRSRASGSSSSSRPDLLQHRHHNQNQSQNRSQAFGSSSRPNGQQSRRAPQAAPQEIVGYLQQLGIFRSEDFSAQLSCPSDNFFMRGISSVDDLNTLGLNLFSAPLQAVRAVYPQWSARLEEAVATVLEDESSTALTDVLDGIDAQLRPFYTAIDTIRTLKGVYTNAAHLETDQRWDGITPLLQGIRYTAVSSLLIKPMQTLVNQLETWRGQNNQKDRIVSRTLRSSILALLVPLQQTYRLIIQARPEMKAILAAFYEQMAAIEKDLSTAKVNYEVALNAIENLPVQYQNAIGRYPPIAAALDVIQAADQERQIRWLRAYLLQPELVRFWNTKPSGISLWVFRGTRDLSIPELFNLSTYLPANSASQQAQLGEQPDVEADAALAAQLQREENPFFS